jgi:hypothetical protein
MKYIIERSSDRYEKPVSSAVEMEVHFYSWRVPKFRYNPYWPDFEKNHRDIIVENDGRYRGTSKLPEKVWVAEIEDLHNFVAEYGDTILFRPNNEEGLWRVEIYDSYRE